VSQDNRPHAERGREGLLRRLFGRGGHENPQADAQSSLNLEDIQGFVLRGYRMPMVRHFLLTVGVPAAARKLLGRFVSGDETDAPQVTTAQDWHIGFAPGPHDNPADPPRCKPDYCLNLGITWPGLIALEIRDRVPTLSFKSFGAFTAGAAERAALVGDTGPSAPQNWIGGFGTGGDHVLVTLHAISPEAMTTYSDRLTAVCAEAGAFREIWRRDGMAMTEMKDGKTVFTTKVHFGYTDGISMTTVRGGPERYPPDHQQPCEPWLFVLLDEAENYFVPQPRELGPNGSFAVFKMIETDVVGFESFLRSNRDKIDPELLAAKICGRWRDGVPLALSPDTDSPPGGISPEELNNFEYVNADGSGDPKGLRCPVGAHMRRMGQDLCRPVTRLRSRRRPSPPPTIPATGPQSRPVRRTPAPHSAASPAAGPSSSGSSSPSISSRLRPAMPCKSPYSPAVDSTTPRICSSRFAQSRIIVLRSRSRSACMSLNRSTTASIRCRNRGPVRY
jgi:deferrochelatase/peroxidase EfeB